MKLDTAYKIENSRTNWSLSVRGRVNLERASSLAADEDKLLFRMGLCMEVVDPSEVAEPFLLCRDRMLVGRHEPLAQAGTPYWAV